MKQFLLFIQLFCFSIALAQKTFPENGPNNPIPGQYAFVNGTIVIDHNLSYKNGTLVIKDGKIIAAGNNVKIPEGTWVIDLKGNFIYPSFIDVFSDFGMPPAKGNPRPHDDPGYISARAGTYGWNDAVKPEINAAEVFSYDPNIASELRKAGFGSVISSPMDGIVRGSSSFIALADENENNIVLRPKAAASFSFQKGSSTQVYPSSLMGSIALLRQSFYDAEWYSKSKGSVEINLTLQELYDLKNYPSIFDAGDKLNMLRADKIADEFGIQFILRGNGTEYQRIKDIKQTGAYIITSLAFPAAYEVQDEWDAMQIRTSDLKHWELAPFNAALLAKEKIPFCFTAYDLKNKSDVLKNLRKAVLHGLDSNIALASLTYYPALFLKIDQLAGSLHPGKIANFLICSGNILDAQTKIYENWVLGKKYPVSSPASDWRGTYQVKDHLSNDTSLSFEIKGDPQKPSVSVKQNGKKQYNEKIEFNQGIVNLSYSDSTMKTWYRYTGWTEWHDTTALITGKASPRGNNSIWTATRIALFTEKVKTDTIEIPVLAEIIYPFNDYGWKLPPPSQTYLITNSSIWTSENDSLYLNTDLLIRNGKIAAIGKNLSAGNDIIKIDGTGKYITAGIIDEHSHIAISNGVNEGGQAVSSEVRIADVVNSEDINIYRQLAGGVTSAQLLHGSANPIGGQSQIIKLRWGSGPEQMKFKGASPFIKFALGENVKQSNHGDRNTVRFPQTRMGVEQTMMDAFTRAKKYEIEWKKYSDTRSKNSVPPRKDLELDALVEILNKKRFITCHSYVQSEINMLMRVADSIGFTVNTFTHVLEGYKVAEEIKEHGAAASTFADWWAYKFEVIDAIPYNAAILTRKGVLTAINSDDAEMGRRLNQEAGKTIKYGGLTEFEAIKLITINPAKMLHVEHLTGSIKVGKDADIVLWSANPLSIYAIAEKTFVDGILLYDFTIARENENKIEEERKRIIYKMMRAVQKGEESRKPAYRSNPNYHCED